jgi:2-phospho-L-lactate guanylyltransferase
VTAVERGLAVWAIVPVKPLAFAKSRLAPLLTPEQRQVLSRELLRHILQVLSRVEGLDGVLVVSNDAEVLALAETEGAVGLPERRPDFRSLRDFGSFEHRASLNRALAQATEWVKGHGGGAVLILPVDLPLLQPADVREILQAGRVGPVVVIVPCRRGEGTNALLVRPPGLIEYRFGPGSFAQHGRQAVRKGAALRVYRSSHLELDLDLPEDVRQWRQTLDASF